jgi:FMN phosphatase YigB (HAD superfamily)
MIYTENKIVMSCRVAPETKEVLEQEANESGTPLSAYVETIIRKREAILQAELLEEEIEQIQASLQEEKQVNKRLLAEELRLRNEMENLKLRLQMVEQLDWLSNENVTTLLQTLETLSKRLPKFNKQQLLLGALTNTVANEKSSFEVLNLRDFFKKNPNFLTSKSQTV